VTVTATTTVTTTPPALVASPDNTCPGAVQFTTPTTGESLSKAGVTVGLSTGWFYLDDTNGSSFTITLTGSGSPAASNDVLDVFPDCASASEAANVTTFTASANGFYFFSVEEASGGTDGGYTVTVSGN
jgi:hypothetical protein